MKRLVQAIFLLVCTAAIGIALYYLIRERAGAAAAARPIAERHIVVSPEEEASDPRASQEDRDASVNRIAALPNEVVLDVATFNFDQDEGEEQVLTVRKTDRKDGRLSIVLADYIPQRRGWARSWEGETLTTKPTTFALQAKDMVGDHILDIVCTGMDDAGQQTISIFRREKGEGPLTYATACAIAADAVAVDETERGESYHLGQSDGASWDILAYRRDKDSPNILDQVKETWSWDRKQGVYVKVAETDIPGAQVERDIVSRILTGSEKDFEDFLQGVWLESGKAPSDQAARILVFDRPAAAITFYTAEAQELFTWLKSDPTRYGLYARCKNVTVESLIRLMDIELTGADAIAVRIFEDLQMKVDPENRWDGSYRKLEQGSAETLGRQGNGRGSPAFKLEGPYKAADGSEITFAHPSYILKRGEAAERGSFGIYKLGSDTVLDLSAKKDDGFAGVRKTYRVTFIETKSGKDTVRRLVLTPARAAINGLETLEEPNQAFEQRIRG